MKKVSMYSAVASVFLLAAAPAALAQNYNPNYGPDTNQSQNWNRSGSDWNRSGTDWNRSGMQGSWNQGSDQGWNQGRYGAGNQSRYNSGYNSGWNQGSGSSQPAGSQQSGMRNRDMNGPTAQDAWQELSKYGYKNIGGMERAEGWQARATKNGERVFVFIDDDGTVATYRGAGQ
jgi:hypothetical protein